MYIYVDERTLEEQLLDELIALVEWMDECGVSGELVQVAVNKEA